MTSPLDYDAIVVGAGFGGIYMCKKLVDQGLSVTVIEAAPDVGGTWYWNRYPGAMSDTPSVLYRYSWDLDDLRQYPWDREYVRQPEVFGYLRHVVDRHELRQYMQFNTEMKSAFWDEAKSYWIVSLSTGAKLTSRYLVTAVGVLSKQNHPQIPGLSSFRGESYHSGSWPDSHDFKNKRVGIIGNGSTGVQIITTLAERVKHLVSFQRHPQYVVPAGDREVPAEVRSQINDRYEEIWKKAKASIFAFGFQESTRRTFSVDEEERERIFEEAWEKGGGFNFMFGTFCDVSYDEEANRAASDFIKKKIRQTVHDPVKAERLIPTERYARRPLCDTGYYEKFNQPNVDIINVSENPIIGFTENGIRTSDEVEYELDVVVFATGFDAVDGSYKRVDIRGVSNRPLKDAWNENPCSYLGISVPDFPNLFMVLGPNSPFVNIPPAIETQVEFIADLVFHANNVASPKDSRMSAVVEADLQATQEWTKLCDEISANSIFRKANSWLFGANIAGKKHGILFYLGGLATYRNVLQSVVQGGYKGFKTFDGMCSSTKEEAI